MSEHQGSTSEWMMIHMSMTIHFSSPRPLEGSDFYGNSELIHGLRG